MGISPATYATYESGRLPDARISEAAHALGVPESFFEGEPIQEIPAGQLSYRRKVALKAESTQRVQGMAALAVEYRGLIEAFVNLPPVSVPYAQINLTQDIEDFVMETRNHWQMSDAPVRSAIGLIESMGVLVFWIAADSAFDGVSFWHQDRPYIILNSTQLDGYRARFTALHELGHLALHRRVEHIGPLEDERKRRDREADLFASSMLMPASAFGRRFRWYGELESHLEDRRFWGASCAAMIRRARDLRLIDDRRYQRLQVQISAKGWRRGEPNARLPETSRVQSYFLEEAADQGKTTEKLARMIGHPVRWLVEAFPSSGANQMSLSSLFDEL